MRLPRSVSQPRQPAAARTAGVIHHGRWPACGASTSRQASNSSRVSALSRDIGRGRHRRSRSAARRPAALIAGPRTRPARAGRPGGGRRRWPPDRRWRRGERRRPGRGRRLPAPSAPGATACSSRSSAGGRASKSRHSSLAAPPSNCLVTSAPPSATSTLAIWRQARCLQRIAGAVAAHAGEVVVAGAARAILQRLPGQRQRRRILFRPRIDQRRRIRPPVAPGPQQAQRKARLQAHARRPQPAARGGRRRQRDRLAALRRHVGRVRQRRPAVADERQPDRKAVVPAAVDQLQLEARLFAGEHRRCAARDQVQVRQVAKSQDHVDHAARRQQEGQAEAEAERIVDGADEQDHQQHEEAQAGPARQDEHAPVVQEHFARLGIAQLEQPAIEPAAQAASQGLEHGSAVQTGTDFISCSTRSRLAEGAAAGRLQRPQPVRADRHQHRLHVLRDDVVAAFQRGPGARRLQQRDRRARAQALGEQAAAARRQRQRLHVVDQRRRGMDLRAAPRAPPAVRPAASPCPALSACVRRSSPSSSARSAAASG